MAKIGKKTKSVKKKVAASVVKKSAKTKAIKPTKKTGGTQKVSAAAGKRLNAKSVGMEFILIPAGKFKMARGGRNPESSRVSVTLTQSFGLGKYEVTQGQWKEVMGTEPWDGQQYVKADKDCPATYVSWDDATEFCEKLTAIERKAGKLKADEEYRLPTEAEWEYACRAGTTTAFSFGNNEKQLGDYAWFRGNADDVGEKYAHKVGTKKPNPWGLYDMHGNAAEWCLDSYEDEMYPCAAAIKDVDYIITDNHFSTDPVGREGSIRVFRGGCWGDYPGSCRSASSSMDVLGGDPNELGFRVARSQSVQDFDGLVLARKGVCRPAFVKRWSAAEHTLGFMDFISIPAGSFTMGSPEKEKDRGDDEKQVPVTITRAFELGKTVVTQKQWTEVMGTDRWNWENDKETGDNYPAVYVTWDDASLFCECLTSYEREAGRLSEKQTYRLPTEAEWEYACRAGTTTAYSCGNAESSLGDYAWYDDNSGAELHEVATKKPNPWGLFDMHGNVWEWCEDGYEGSLSGGNDPKGSSAGSYRVIRGGNWYSSASNCRSASRRSYLGPTYRYNRSGFRIVRVLL